LINDQHKFLDEGKLGGKHQDHFLKGKGKVNHKERGWFDTPIHRLNALTKKLKGGLDEPWKNRKKKTCPVLWKDWTCGESMLQEERHFRGEGQVT
jgi:hypothetical protein